jgi:hypothetical protein
MSKRPVAVLTSALALACITLTTVGARAESHEPASAEREFGDRGVLAIGVGTRLDAAIHSVAPPTGSRHTDSSIEIGGDVAYFVARGVSVGAIVSFGHESKKIGDATETTTSFGAQLRAGHNLWITPGRLSFWPQLALGWTRAAGSDGSTDTTTSHVQVGVYAPLLVHPAAHLHLGVGPYLLADLTGSGTVSTPTGSGSGDASKAMTLGLMGEIGGWL